MKSGPGLDQNLSFTKGDKEVMFQKSSLINSLIPLLLHFTINYSSSLPTTLNISMQSVNMKHILIWSPLQAHCFTVNYSVQFQGEYELHKLNGTWVDAYDCQEISESKCDLTSDLAFNSDYSIRIKTICDGQESWAELPATFNRRNTVLLAPKMMVAVEGDLIQVDFSTTLPDMIIILRVWKEGDEQNALLHVIRVYPYHFSIAAHRGEKRMCFKAKALVEAINKSCSTDKQCVFIPKPTSDFVKPVMVSIAVVVAVAMASILGWLATRFGPQIKQTICHSEPLPNVLLYDSPTSTPILCTDVSLEPTDPLLLLPSVEGQCSDGEAECRT
ncbi:interleukin-20 receptor subunit beta-like [Xyrauchen texanus]|uniref:interleukin-20 receptor subunit beta-like n=1 Tax=Xyrauchen texanus TaxID=154827 RepID=UPI002241C032|nr:interleukin-20 receptor subunit beta-like [Xyrauchen texanus]XP_051983661.1 interleukin-20 receptor subunit beta-like [Xyrauchen texanus]